MGFFLWIKTNLKKKPPVGPAVFGRFGTFLQVRFNLSTAAGV
jgi:hypothetical protein